MANYCRAVTKSPRGTAFPMVKIPYYFGQIEIAELEIHESGMVKQQQKPRTPRPIREH
jgi:hypothetical protein